jgi:hypothetical protein
MEKAKTGKAKKSAGKATKKSNVAVVDRRLYRERI